MKLYSFRHSLNPLKVRLALAEIDATCETVEIHLFKREHRTPEYAQFNPCVAVPVLEDQGHVIRESNAILFYLARKFGKLIPAGPQSEIEALQWLFFESAELGRSAGILWWTETVVPQVKLPGWGEDDLKEAAEDVGESLDILDQQLSDRAFLLGSEFSIADCSIGVMLNALRKTRMKDLSKWKNVNRFIDQIRARKSWSTAHGDAIYEMPSVD